MILYGHPLSGNTHKVRLLLSALGLKYEERVVDITVAAHKKAEFLALNPRGQLPVLVDGEATIYDAQAILVYLARRYDRTGTWLPNEPYEQALVTEWLSFASNEIQNGLHATRVHQLLGVTIAVEQALGTARASLALLENRLQKRPFLELDHLTIADLACFPCVGLAGDAKVSLTDYPRVRQWIASIKAMPFYVAMAGLDAAA